MIHLLLFLASLSWSEQTKRIPNSSDDIDQEVTIKALQNGRPIFTSTPTFQSVSLISNGGGGITFQDGTIQTTAGVLASGGSGTATYLPKWLSGTSLGNSSLIDNGSHITVTNNATFTSTLTVFGVDANATSIASIGKIQLGNVAASTSAIRNNGGNDFSVIMATASTVGGSGGSIFECGLHFAATNRLACDLQKPTNYPKTDVAEFTITHTTTSATASEGFSWTDNGYRTGFNFFQETSGGGPADDITFALADHNNLGNARGGNGTDRAAIQICNYDDAACGPFGSTVLEGFAQTNNESFIDTRPIANVQIRPPDWPTASNGFGDSPPFIIGGVSYDGSAHRLSWEQYVRATSNAGASSWILGQQDITVNGSGSDAIPKISTMVWIADTGKLAINKGNSPPATNLDIDGNAQFGTGVTKSTFSTTGALTMAAGIDITLQEGRALTWNGTGESIYGSVSSDYIRIKTNSTDRLHVDTSGKIGINTLAPTTQLDVNGNSQFGSGVTKSTFSTTGALSLASGAALTLTGSAGYITSQSSINTNGLISAASIGIGQTSPAAQLDIGNNSKATPAYSFSADGEGLLFNSGDDAGARYDDIVAIGNTPAGATTALRFWTNTGGGSGTATERMRITGIGNVGIGSTNPTSTMTVAGVIAISGTVPTVSSCGTGTPSVTGTDNSGTITTGTAATSCTLTFANNHGSAPNSCVVSTNSTATTPDVSSISATAVTFGLSVGLSGGKVYYQCF